jgi:hypothetical protein
METPTYGPVELFVIAFDADEPPEAVVAAVAELALEQTVTILDLVLVRRTEDGYTIVEIHEFADQYGFPALELEATGLTAEEDVEEVAGRMPVGSSALIIEVEMTWARNFVRVANEAGAELLFSARIPAEVVNEVVAAAKALNEGEGK